MWIIAGVDASISFGRNGCGIENMIDELLMVREWTNLALEYVYETLLPIVNTHSIFTVSLNIFPKIYIIVQYNR